MRQRFQLSGSSFTPLVSGFEDGSLILGRISIGSGQAYIFTAFLNDDNPQFQEWAYFNYLIYHLVESSAGRTPLTFARYPASPVPHTGEQVILYLLLAGLLIISGLAFWIVRRYSLRHPEALDVVVSDREKFIVREASTDWEDIGFHRPLAGFFMAFFLGILVFIPLIIYQNLILPVYILPSAQAVGIWGRVTQFFALIWNFFDMGTSIAFIKFLSQYRVHDPRRACPIRAGVRLVAGTLRGSPGGHHGGSCWLPLAPHSICHLCLEHYHPHFYPDPWVLPGDAQRPHRFAALMTMLRSWTWLWRLSSP